MPWWIVVYDRDNSRPRAMGPYSNWQAQQVKDKTKEESDIIEVSREGTGPEVKQELREKVTQLRGYSVGKKNFKRK